MPESILIHFIIKRIIEYLKVKDILFFNKNCPKSDSLKSGILSKSIISWSVNYLTELIKKPLFRQSYFSFILLNYDKINNPDFVSTYCFYSIHHA